MYTLPNRWKSWVGCCVCVLALLLALPGCDDDAEASEEAEAAEEAEADAENGDEADDDGEENGGPTGRQAEAHVEVAEVEIRRITEMVNTYFVRLGELPEELEVLTEGRNMLLEEIPEDPWGNEYVYEVLGERDFKIFSKGPDGEAGTDDDIVVE